MDLGIDGKVALVTASSRGLGRASARSARRRGGAPGAVRPQRGPAARQPSGSSPSRGPRCWPWRPTSPIRLLPSAWSTAAVERFGRLDIVVANAGGPPPGRCPRRRRRRHPRRGGGQPAVAGSAGAGRASPHAGRAAGGGCAASRRTRWSSPSPALALSNTARTGLRAWAKTAAADLAAEGSGITLNLVCPGPHATDRMRELGGTRAHG